MLSKYSIFTRLGVIGYTGPMRNNSNWKAKLNNFFFSFHKEVIKTSAIGKKMLTASRTNAHLKDTYEELGRLLEKGIESEEVKWDSAKVRSLLHTVQACKKDLEEIEQQVYKIKFSASPKGPLDISKELPKELPDETKKD